MISEQQQEQASLYAAGALTSAEQDAFENALLDNPELLELTRNLQRTVGLMAAATPSVELPAGLKEKMLARIAPAGRATPCAPPALLAGLRFTSADDQTGWKQLPIPGAWIKLLSLEKDRGYAVLMGKLDPGARYPAHVNAGPEDFLVLTGDLHIGSRRLGPGDFHHADGGSQHEENYSLEGCTLIAVLTTDDPLVGLAMA
jgi:anti-sigma factor ChrR (cupin superfamily)